MNGFNGEDEFTELKPLFFHYHRLLSNLINHKNKYSILIRNLKANQKICKGENNIKL